MFKDEAHRAFLAQGCSVLMLPNGKSVIWHPSVYEDIRRMVGEKYADIMWCCACGQPSCRCDDPVKAA